MTLKAIVSHVGSITTTSATKTWSFQVMWKSTHNETPNIKVYHHYLHIVCHFFEQGHTWCFKWHHVWLFTDLQMGQQVKCVLDASTLCPHSHVKRLNAKGWIKSKQKRNVKVKVERVLQNEWINGLETNHNLAPLLKQERMWILDARNGIIFQDRPKGCVVMDVHQRCL
jgi:hypothetical protein